jgi:hypothetical protein
MWFFKVAGEERTPILSLRDGTIYVDENCRMRCTDGFVICGNNSQGSIVKLLEVADQWKKEKTKKRRESRRRAKLRKQGWILNTGTEPGVHGKVDILFFDGTTYTATDYHWAWNIKSRRGKEIQAYRPVKEEGKVISLEAMTKAVANDLGKEVMRVPEANGWIEHRPGIDPAPSDAYEVKLRDGDIRLADQILTFGSDHNSISIQYDRQVVAYRRAVDHNVKVEPAGGFVEVPEPQPDTNPKKQYGLASIPLHMWSPLASAYGALGLYNGSLKYGSANFANTPVEASIYIAAAQRHLAAWASGEEFDPADGVPNLGGVLANVAILLEARAAGTLIDDRLSMAGYLKERDTLKDIVKKLQEVHAGKNPRHYTIADKKEG